MDTDEGVLSKKQIQEILSRKFGPDDADDDIKHVFQEMRLHGKPTLDVEAMQGVAKQLGENLTKQDLMEMLEIFKDNGRIADPEKGITLEEFMELMHEDLLSADPES